MANVADANNKEVGFALNPAGAVAGIINMGTAEGREFYKDAKEKLQEELYDCNAEGMFAFLQALKDRANEYGWMDDLESGIMHIPDDPVNPYINTRNLLSEYRTVSTQAIRRFEETYIGTQTRVAQDTNMLYACLMNSLSTIGKDRIATYENEFKIQSTPLN